MRRKLVVGAVLALSGLGSPAFAQDPPARATESEPPKEAGEKAAAPAAAPAEAAPAAAAPAEEIRRDPKGITGINPFWEAVSKGDKAYIARDFESAVTAYREAVRAEPQNPLGHYRMGEALVAKGDAAEAERSFGAALRFAGKDQRMRAKVLFVMADLRERQNQLDDATKRWTEYETLVTKESEAKGFPATAVERKKRIEAWKKTSAESAEVKKRIEARLKEAEEAAKKNAK